MPKRKTTDNDLNTFYLAAWITMTIFIIVGSLLRITGAYDLNAYIYDLEINEKVGLAVQAVLYIIDVFLFFKITTNKSNTKLLTISVIWTIVMNLFFKANIVQILEPIFLLLVPFILTRKLKSIPLILAISILYNIVQRVFIYCLFGNLDIMNKYDTLIAIGMIGYYQLYILFSFINLRRKEIYGKITR